MITWSGTLETSSLLCTACDLLSRRRQSVDRTFIVPSFTSVYQFGLIMDQVPNSFHAAKHAADPTTADLGLAVLFGPRRSHMVPVSGPTVAMVIEQAGPVDRLTSIVWHRAR